MEKFTWVHTFEQISAWLLQYEKDQKELVQILKKIGVSNGLEDKDADGNIFLLKEIDPFSFVALILKHGGDKISQIIQNLSDLENLNLTIPTDYSGVPKVQPMAAWFFAYSSQRKKSDIKTLWHLFIAIHQGEELDQLFNNSLEIKQTGMGKLSQMMFMLFPAKFFPIDSQTESWLIDSKILTLNKKLQWVNYKNTIDRFTQRFNYSFPELSYRCWFINTHELNAENLDILLETNYSKISEGTDKIKGFINHSNKQLALEIGIKKDNSTGKNFIDLDNFNIILEHTLDTKIPYKWRVVGNSNLSQKNAPNLSDKEVCVFRIKNESHSWSDVLDILDLYDGCNISKEKNLVGTQDREVDIKKNEKKMLHQPLNQILYGPPGTGKTYATTELAVQIADPEWYASLTVTEPKKRHKTIKEKYDELIKAKQIAFTTFHQSFSYEDFIEGLKAYIPEGEKNIAYKVEDGIFKQIVTQAQKAEGINKSDTLGLNDAPKIWKIALGETWDVERRKRYFENSEIRIGWNASGNLLNERNADQIKYFESLGPNDQASLYDFSEEMKIGDVVLCLRDRKSIQAIGIISSEYSFDEQAYETDIDFAHVRKVKWLAKGLNFNILLLNHNFQLGIKSVHELSRFSWVQLVEELKSQNIIIKDIHETTKLVTSSVNHVLIMDEINRGNISKIFGELITLIEDDKRAGKPDARELTLPYSKEPFTVPSNLYLIGTMNTADKSLTQLDLALRRRFEFKEVGPDIKILEDMEASQHDVDVPLMLKKMNQRIQYLKGKDYQIGHSYFMPLCLEMDQEQYLQTLRRIFENKIIPLLKEYFFSNLKHICLVMNDNSDDTNDRKIIHDLNIAENIFGYEQQPPKANPLYTVELNLDCFGDLKRFQQIYQ